MITEQQEASVRMHIVVAAPVERAFRVFTEEFDRIKPREHNMLGVPIAETVFEPRVGGHIFDRGVDGSECRWGRVDGWRFGVSLERTSGQISLAYLAEVRLRRATWCG